MDTPLIDKLNKLPIDTSKSLEEVHSTILSYENVLMHKELEQIAIIISHHWRTTEKETTIKKRSIPYKIKLLYKNSSSRVDLSELPVDLLYKIYAYIMYIFT